MRGAHGQAQRVGHVLDADRALGLGDDAEDGQRAGNGAERLRHRPAPDSPRQRRIEHAGDAAGMAHDGGGGLLEAVVAPAEGGDGHDHRADHLALGAEHGGADAGGGAGDALAARGGVAALADLADLAAQLVGVDERALGDGGERPGEEALDLLVGQEGQDRLAAGAGVDAVAGADGEVVAQGMRPALDDGEDLGEGPGLVKCEGAGLAQMPGEVGDDRAHAVRQRARAEDQGGEADRLGADAVEAGLGVVGDHAVLGHELQEAMHGRDVQAGVGGELLHADGLAALGKPAQDGDGLEHGAVRHARDYPAVRNFISIGEKYALGWQASTGGLGPAAARKR